MSRIEDRGGILNCIEDGSIRREIALQAYELEKNIQSGKKTVVGVNKFTSGEKQREVELYEPSEDILQRQRSRLKEVKGSRDQEEVTQALAKVRRLAAGGENLLPPILEAVRAYASVGEICNVLKEVFGEYQEAT